MVASPEAGGGNGKIVQLTVRQAMARYIDYKRHKGQPVGDLISRSNVHILPALGDLVVSELSAEQLRRWLATMAAAPAQRRAKGNKPQYRPEPTTDEEIRQRRASANRVLTMLKAALNHAYDEGARMGRSRPSTLRGLTGEARLPAWRKPRRLRALMKRCRAWIPDSAQSIS
jgi:hypothetical protein